MKIEFLLGISDLVLWVSRWPDGEPLAGGHPFSCGWATGFPIGPLPRVLAVFLWLPALPHTHYPVPTHTILSQCECSVRNGITWRSRLRLFVSTGTHDSPCFSSPHLLSFFLAICLGTTHCFSPCRFSPTHNFTLPPTPVFDRSP